MNEKVSNDKGNLIGYLYLLDYNTTSIIELEVWENEYNRWSNMESLIEEKGFSLDEVSYMYSDCKLEIETL